MINFDNTYGLTDDERTALSDKNAKCGWGFSDSDVLRFAKAFKAAHRKGDVKTMGGIVYRLVDCNFHKEANILCAGEYDKLIKSGGSIERIVSES